MKQKVVIGKYTLESLTNGMYASPLDLYREYVQNAVDSIDEAVKNGIGEKAGFKIEIEVDREKRKITIRDNGTGISEKEATKTLTDVGSSRKKRRESRGFRGIGRLAGLGYCKQLIFSTSYLGETVKSIIIFNADELNRILLSNDSVEQSVTEVMEQVITVKTAEEKAKLHYFTVEMIEVNDSDKLLLDEQVKNYLVQHAPLKYSHEFKWQDPIIEKTIGLGCSILAYNILFNGEHIYKPYRDTFESDRVKRSMDYIKDIEVIPFYRNDRVSAILWCASTNYFGTITENAIKGIRIRQGNILIGDKFTCNSFFKEERFNGWLIGELHVFDNDLIVNARRDDFEKNEAYYVLAEKLKEWSAQKSKEIRKISYRRSLSLKKRAIIEAQSYEDINDLLDESIELGDDFGESELIYQGESESVAEADFISQLSSFINQKNASTKYMVLNINRKLSLDQKKVLERVFDLIVTEYGKEQAEKFINVISKKF